MSNTTISPSMNLPIPVVGVDAGPDWATNINSCLTIIDQHNHTPGQGDPVTPSGLDINADLPFGGNNITNPRSVRFIAQGSPLSAGADLGCIYVSGVDLYYNDGSGNHVRITQSGSVTGASGTITGLPSGTASVAYAGGTFTFQSATSTPGAMAVGPLTIGQTVSGSKTVTLTPSASQAVNYALTLPIGAPTGNQVIATDASGNLSWSWGQMPIGSVIATFPSLTGAYSTAATTVSDAYGFVLCAGQTIADATSPMNGQVIPNINNSVFLQGSVTDNTAGGAASASYVHSHVFYHTHAWAHQVGGGQILTNQTSDHTTNIIASTIGGTAFVWQQSVNDHNGSASSIVYSSDNVRLSNLDFYTSGVNGAPSGSGSSATTADGGGTINTVPPYISAVYLMRIK